MSPLTNKKAASTIGYTPHRGSDFAMPYPVRAGSLRATGVAAPQEGSGTLFGCGHPSPTSAWCTSRTRTCACTCPAPSGTAPPGSWRRSTKGVGEKAINKTGEKGLIAIVAYKLLNMVRMRVGEIVQNDIKNAEKTVAGGTQELRCR